MRISSKKITADPRGAYLQESILSLLSLMIQPKEAVMETKEAYKKKLEAQLNEWSAQINFLSAKAKNKGADVNLQLAKTLEDLKAKQMAVTQKIKELDGAGSEAWDSVSMTAEKVLNDLKKGVGEALSKFK
jgi:hypothetical protein